MLTTWEKIRFHKLEDQSVMKVFIITFHNSGLQSEPKSL